MPRRLLPFTISAGFVATLFHRITFRGVQPMLKEQADLVCACDTYECGMDVLKGPINEKLKKMDESGPVELSETAKADKKRMLGCILNLKSKQLGGNDSDSQNGPATDKTKSKPFESAEGRFSATYPFSTENKTTTDQKKISWVETKATKGMYNVSYADFASPAKAQAYIDDFVKTMKKETKSQKDVKVGSNAGVELEMVVSERATMWVRMFAIDKRVYKVAAGTRNDKKKAYAFLDTFAVK